MGGGRMRRSWDEERGKGTKGQRERERESSEERGKGTKGQRADK